MAEEISLDQEENSFEQKMADETRQKYSFAWIKEWCATIMAADEKMKTRSHDVNQRIPKVSPVFAREFGMDLFRPKVVSIGPYHHRKVEPRFMEDLKHFQDLMPLEDMKPLIAKRLLELKEFQGLGILDCCMSIMSEIHKVRQFYDEDCLNNITDEQLVKIMVLDGCFVLYFMGCYTSIIDGYLEMSNYQIELTRQDLLLMENQIPFQILFLLSRRDDGFIRGIIREYIHLNVSATFVSILDPLHTSDQALHILDAVEKTIVGKFGVQKSRIKRNMKGPLLRKVKELAAVGISFKAIETGSINDISFNSFGLYGRLSLPIISVDKSTKSLFLNLIAYDNSTKDFSITSYICFLDSLIDNSEDVKELRSAGIIINNLNKDEEVAELFNDMGAKLIPDGDSLSKVKAKMQKYLKSRRKVKIASWLAELIRNHFRSPLKIFTVLAATFAIFLTAIQSYYAVFKK